jgi:hypothetical protein
LTAACLDGLQRNGLALPRQVPSAESVNGEKVERHGQNPKAATNVRSGSRRIGTRSWQAIEGQDEITLVELAEFLTAEHAAVFAQSTIWRFLDRHAMTLKKQRTRASRSGPTLPRGDAPGSKPSLILIPNGWSLGLSAIDPQSATRDQMMLRGEVVVDGGMG